MRAELSVPGFRSRRFLVTLRGAVSGRGGRGVEGRLELGGWVAGDQTKGAVGPKGVWRNGLIPAEGCGVKGSISGRRRSVSVLMGPK